MTLKIGNIEFKNNVVLAPMAGITDLPYRLICKEFGVGYTYTELVSAKGIIYNSENTLKLCQIDPNERPTALQLFGGDKNVLGSVAKIMDNDTYDILDINMGCPAPKVTRNAEGSALMKDPMLIGEIVKSVVSNTSKPVTVKIRRGFDENNVNAVEIAKIVEDNGASAIAVHGRTRSQFYSGKSDIEIIKKVVNAVSIPVIGNGDITTPQEAKYMLDYTGCDFIMIGRGVRGNPWLIDEILTYLKDGTIKQRPSTNDVVNLAIRHLEMLMTYKGDYKGIREMRKHIGWYTKGLYGSSELRTLINKATTFDEITTLLKSLI